MTNEVDWKEVGFFLSVTMGLAWLTALPLWISDVGVSDPIFVVVSLGTMLTPTIGTAVTTVIFRPRDGIARSTGLVVPRPRRKLWVFSAIGLGYPVVVAVVALPIGIATGTMHLDVVGLSGLRALGATWFGLDGAHGTAAVLVTSIVVVTAAFLVGLVPCFWEEWGWRGYLIPRLLPLGTWPALLLSGVLWALWHAPLILRGFNYDSNGLAGIGAMVVFCVLAGIVLGWLDLRSGSVWPAVVAHSSNNSFAVLLTSGFFVDTAIPVDPVPAQIPLWLTTALLVFVLHRWGRLNARASTFVA